MLLTQRIVIILLATGAHAGIFFAIIAWRRRGLNGARPFSLMTFGAAIWALGYTLVIVSPELSQKIIAAKLQYIGIVTVPGAYLASVLLYSRARILSSQQKLWQWLLLVQPMLILVLVGTYPHSRLVWTDIGLCDDCTIPILSITPGPWYWMNVAYSYSLLLFGNIILIRAMRKAPERYRRQSVTIVLAIVAPWIGNLLYMLGIRPFKYLDLTPVGFLFTAFAFGITILRVQILDYAPFAQQCVAETFPDAYFFIDHNGNVVDCNKHAFAFIQAQEKDIMSHPVQQIIPSLSLANVDFTQPIEYTKEIAWNGLEILPIEEVLFQTWDADMGHKYYEMKITPMSSQGTAFIGNLLTFTDTTAHLVLQWETMANNSRLERKISERTSELETMNLQLRTEVSKRSAIQEDLASKVSELSALHTVGQAVAERLSLQQVADQATVAIRRAMQMDVVLIYGKDTDRYRFLSEGHTERLTSMPLDLAHDIGDFFFEHIVAPEIMVCAVDTFIDPWLKVLTTNNTHMGTIIALPLLSGQEDVGLLMMIAQANHDFSVQSEFLESMALEIGLALHNARLYEESQSQLGILTAEVGERRRIEQELKSHNLRLATLNRIAAAMSGELEVNRLLQAVLDQLIDFPGIEATWLHTNTTSNRITVFPSTSTTSPNHIPTLTLAFDDAIQRVMGSGVMEIIPIPEGSAEVQTMALMMVPLIARANVLGVLTALCSFEEIGMVDCQDLLESVGHQVALGLENVQLHDTSVQIEVYEELNRLRSDLIANVSHEIRTPLGLIKLLATTLQMGNETMPPADRLEFLESIEAESNVLEKLVNDLLGLSRYDVGKLDLHCEVLDLREVVKEVIDSMHLELTNRELVLTSWTESLRVDGDAFRLQQVIRNLVSNAVKYSPEDTAITIRTYVEESDAIISVADQGIGIPVELQHRVFERFFRVDDSSAQARGVGLGLALSKIIAESHDGQLWFDSTPGHGSIFYLTLPLLSED